MKKIGLNASLKIFKTACKKYINLFGLKCFEYDIHFDIDPEDDARHRAGFDCNLTAGMITITLSRSWILKCNPSKREIEKSAFHEVCETMLSQLRNMGEEHYSYNIVDKEIHKVIRILENTFFKE